MLHPDAGGDEGLLSKCGLYMGIPSQRELRRRAVFIVQKTYSQRSRGVTHGYKNSDHHDKASPGLLRDFCDLLPP